MRTLFTILLVLILSQAKSQLLKIMTYNIRYDYPADGINSWSNRKHRLLAMLGRYRPDILGVQEAQFNQVVDLVQNLDGYGYVGVGRDNGKQNGEYAAILYQSSEFDLLDHKTFWLSETPEAAGSKSWDAAITRVVTWARLYSKRSQSEIVVLNTHFDHQGKKARIRSAELIRKKLSEIVGDLPFVLMGDLNFTREEPPYKILINSDRLKLIDAAPSPAPGTFCGFEAGSAKCLPIDYIFYSKQWKMIDYNVLKDNNGKYYPSDHLPVMVNIRLIQK
jgi:endonuclease/exonuclease/phosphatase family metal-dependent hydrolase